MSWLIVHRDVICVPTRRVFRTLVVVLTSATAAAGQQPTADPVRPDFASASVQPTTSAAPASARGIRLQPAGGFSATGVTLRELIEFAYRRHAFDRREVTGGPAWIDSARFDVVAKAAGDHVIDADGSPRRTWAMVRGLLEDRFKLRVHEENRDRPVYVLMQARDDRQLGPKLRRSEIDCGAVMRGERPQIQPGQGPPCGMKTPPGRLFANTVTMLSIASLISSHVDRVVIDGTGLTGRFDVELEAAEIKAAPDYRPGPSDLALPPAAGPTIFVAIREQLGLKLEPRTAPVSVLVVDRAERPSETLIAPRFADGMLLEATSDESANVSIGDLNNDGNLDVVLVKGRHYPFVDRVLFGDGRGGFPTVRDLGANPDRSYSGRLVDIDRDGDLDVVISNDSPDPKVVHLNDGTGHFRVGGTYGDAQWPTRNASVADMNGDSLPDIIVANRTGDRPGSNYICLNKGGGQFDADCILFSRESATTITPADFNRDGFTDLVVPHRDGGQSYVYMHEAKPGIPTFTRIPFGPVKATIRVSDVADFDGDGRLDIAAVDERRGVALYFGQEGQTFSAAVIVSKAPAAGAPANDTPAGAPYALLVGDVNLDGKPDLLVGKVLAPSTVHINDGSGRTFASVQLGDGNGTAYGFAIGDLNKDGRPDIVVARSGAPNLLFLAK